MVNWRMNDARNDEGTVRSAVVLAGGQSSRLKPITSDTPKPLLPVGDTPLLDRTLASLAAAGVERVHVATHYRHEQVADHLEASDLDIDLQVVREETPLGTAGSLRLIEWEGPLLVINGDVLARVDFEAMLAHHREQEALISVGVARHTLRIPFGVVEVEGLLVTSLAEKPEQSFLINAGVYLLEPGVAGFFPAEARFDMTDLIARALAGGGRVAGFPIEGYWLDVGNPDTYRQAQADVAEGGRFHAGEASE